MSRFGIYNLRRFALALAVSIFGLVAHGAAAQPTGGDSPDLAYAKQGWSEADRNTFYTTSQGSHMVPQAWFNVLRRVDIARLFAGHQPRRSRYLPNSVF